MYKKFTLFFCMPPGCAHRILLIMKLTTALMIAAFLQVSAAGFAQKLTYRNKQASLEQIFREIRRQTGYKVLVSANKIRNVLPQQVNFDNTGLPQVLDQVLRGQPLTYEIEDHTILIKEKELSIFDKIKSSLSIAETVTGKVTDTANNSLPGATLKIKGRQAATTDSNGAFTFTAEIGDEITVSYIGYQSFSFAVSGNLPPQQITLHASFGKLKEVLVTTGYQTFSRERATGSFVQVGRELLERSVSTDITDRLRDVVAGLTFNPIATGTTFSIRGQSTLFSNAEPLIVVDGFPYNQPVSDLNPNDVESITVLKDAAAASIWGSRAGNGVIVIVTKKGSYNHPLKVTLNSNVTVTARPNLNYIPHMSSADYIGIEKRLFSQDYFSGTENAYNNLPLSPVVELLIAQRDGQLSAAETDSRIAALTKNDVWKDIAKYEYRPAVNQQYALSLEGGSANQRYYYAVGYDKNLNQLVGNGFDRVTLNGNNTWTMLNKKLEISLGINVSENGTDRDNTNFGTVGWPNGTIYPYAKLADANGTPLSITKDYRQGFVDAAPGKGLLDWQYRPLDDVRQTQNRSTITDYRVNTGIKYKLLPGLDIQVQYEYDHSLNNGRDLMDADNYYTRNLINRYTQDDGSGNLTRAIPLGGILDLTSGYSENHDFRPQLNYDHSIGAKGTLTAIAGFEVQTLHTVSDSYRLYGYDTEHATSKSVDYLTQFTYYDNPYASSAIPDNTAETDLSDNNRSYYANAAYSYDQRFTVSGSARLDQSNLFGVRTNQKGVPLWSAGGAWNISKEAFYHLDWLPYLRLRATYGYNGNINKNLSAYTTATYYDGSGSQTSLPYAEIVNPPNPDLRWERFRHINFGLDFNTRDQRISGTFEYYLKNGLDLIGSTAYAPSSGITVFTGNTAGTSGHGFDLSLDTRNLVGKIGWTSNLIVSYITDKVSNYDQVSVAESYLESGSYGQYALQGRPLFAIYSYKSAGLDPQTGDPRGYLNGQLSKDYNTIIATATPGNLVYNGPARPTVSGSLRNNFSYDKISFSFNISYEFGFYYRHRSVFYGDNYGLNQQSGDYALRWQKPGDETKTRVPSLPATTDLQRDQFYTYSSALVEKGDNIRLRDIRLAYTFGQGGIHLLPKANLQMYLYANNLGILWRANHSHTDPDIPTTFPTPPSLAGGIRLNY